MLRERIEETIKSFKERLMDIKQDELITEIFNPCIQIALIIGLAEVVKRLGLESRFIPLLDVLLGLIGGIYVYGISLGFGLLKGILIGIALGLEACGLFSGLKNLFSA